MSTSIRVYKSACCHTCQCVAYMAGTQSNAMHTCSVHAKHTIRLVCGCSATIRLVCGCSALAQSTCTCLTTLSHSHTAKVHAYWVHGLAQASQAVANAMLANPVPVHAHSRDAPWQWICMSMQRHVHRQLPCIACVRSEHACLL